MRALICGHMTKKKEKDKKEKVKDKANQVRGHAIAVEEVDERVDLRVHDGLAHE